MNPSKHYSLGLHMRTFTTFDEITSAAGEDMGTSAWLEITQEQVDTFADATGDHQWIHVDVERAKTGPFGGTIAHGYLTLSLLPSFTDQVITIATPGARVNYGINKVRFPHPVLVGSRVRGHLSFGAVTEIPAGYQLTMNYVVEIEDADKPACVVESIVLLLREEPETTGTASDDEGQLIRS